MSLFGARPEQPQHGVLPWLPQDGRPGTSTLRRDSLASTPLFWSAAHFCAELPVEIRALDTQAISFFSCVPPLLPGSTLTLWNTGFLENWKVKKGDALHCRVPSVPTKRAKPLRLRPAPSPTVRCSQRGRAWCCGDRRR